MNLNKAGFNRFVQRKSKKFVEAAMEAAKDELADRRDLDVRVSSVKSSASFVSAELRVTSDTANILTEELGTENDIPKHTVGRLVKDPVIRERIIRKAVRSLN